MEVEIKLADKVVTIPFDTIKIQRCDKKVVLTFCWQGNQNLWISEELSDVETWTLNCVVGHVKAKLVSS